MPNVRPLNERKYGISKHKFLQIYHFCLQYNEWKDELAYKTSTLKSYQITGMPGGGKGTGKPTESLAIRRAQLSANMELVEQTCMEAGEGIYQWLLKAVTNEGIGYVYLRQCMGIPCGKKMYYEKRRKFYWLMAQKM